ncbi:unnamed protein product, partial [Laminaria digitata]
RFKTEFVEHISHEFRTPMNGVLGMTELLLDEPVTPSGRECAIVISSCGTVVSALISDILDISDISSGKVIPHISVSSIRHIVVDTVKVMLSSSTIRISLKFDDSVPKCVVRVDDIHVRQITINLVPNAKKFTRKGYVEISVRCLECPTPIISSYTESLAGDGPIAMIDKIFDPFTTCKNSVRGTGLCLTISQSLCTLLGGGLGVTSRVGEGSTIKCSFLVGKYEQPPDVETPYATNDIWSWYPSTNTRTCIIIPAEPGEDPENRPLVLVVDDEQVNTLILCRILRGVGVNTETANIGEMAVKACNGQTFSAILMDMSMPVMDGVEATKAKRKSGMNECTPILFVTATVSGASFDKCLESGGTDYTSKPVKRKIIVE